MKKMTREQERKFHQPLKQPAKRGKVPSGRQRDRLVAEFLQTHQVTELPPAGSDISREACAGVE